jgi:hypothetical protein
VIADPNPLVFSYKLQKGEPTNTTDFTEASKFTDALKPLLDILKAFQPKGQESGGIFILAADATDVERQLVANGVDQNFVKDYTESVAKLSTDAKAISGLVDDSLTAGSKVRTDVNAWNFPALKKRLKAQLQTIDDASIILLKTLQISQGPNPRIQVASISPELDFSFLNQSQGTPIGTPLLPAQPTSPQVTPAPQPAPPAPVQPLPAGIFVLPRGTLEREWNLVQASSSYVAKLLATVDTFVEKTKGLDQRMVLGVVDFNAQQDQPLTLTIAKEEKDVTTAQVSGDFKFIASPYSPFALKYDAGIAYAFVNAKRFGTKPDGTAFKIVRTDSGDSINVTTGVAMLSLIPRSFVDAPVGFAWQIGVSPVKDKLGLYLGGSLRLFKLVTFGGGFALQQAQTLASGLTEGQTISAVDQLKTHAVFKPGGYVTLSIEVGGKK